LQASGIRLNSMKVLYTGTSFPRSHSDWRGQFIYQIANALAKNESIDLHTWLPPGINISDTTNITSDIDKVWLDSLLERGGIAHLIRHKPLSGILSSLKLLKLLKKTYTKNCDVDLYHINWLQNALPLGSTKTPAIISVLGTDFKLLDLPGMRLALRRVMKSRNTVITPNADWMVEKLTTLFGDIAQIQTVPFGVDTRWYQIERQLSTTSRKWLVVLRITRAKMGKLFDWGKTIFSGSNDELHLFGPMQEKNITIPDWVHYHGSTNPEELAVNWFPNACAMISLSQHDEGRPQVLLEAMAAGLPIIASSIAAHNDLIQQKTDGFLVDSMANFKDAIKYLSVNKDNINMGNAGRKNMAIKVGTWNDCANKYINIYHTLLN